MVHLNSRGTKSPAETQTRERATALQPLYPIYFLTWQAAGALQVHWQGRWGICIREVLSDRLINRPAAF